MITKWPRVEPVTSPITIQTPKAQYTLVTKLNSTRSTLLKVDKVDCDALAPYTLHTGNKVDRISNKVDCICNKVNRIGNKVDHDKLLNSSCCRFAKTGNEVRRIGNKVHYISNSRLSTKSTVLTNFVTSVYRA